MEKIFENKIAIVTGGSSGIGRATAIAFAMRGAKVAIVDCLDGNETLCAVRSFDGDAIFIHCDVSDSASVKSMIDQVLLAYGRIDYAFNNAGIEGVSAATHLCTEDNWDKVLGINLKGVWLCMKNELAQMLSQGCGAIVNCASVAGLVGFVGSPAYVASKHGIVGLTKTAALENAKTGIRINAVCPGIIRTPMIDRFTGKDKEVEKQFENMEPVGRLGNPEEIAEAVIWLCSDSASFITGHAMPVDGGWVAQ